MPFSQLQAQDIVDRFETKHNMCHNSPLVIFFELSRFEEESEGAGRQ